MKWKTVEGLPKGINMKMDMTPFSKFEGLCEFKIIASSNYLVMEQLNISYPLTAEDYIPEPSEGVYP